MCLAVSHNYVVTFPYNFLNNGNNNCYFINEYSIKKMVVFLNEYNIHIFKIVPNKKHNFHKFQGYEKQEVTSEWFGNVSHSSKCHDIALKS